MTENLQNILNSFNFAPFLMWNEHKNNYFKNLNIINKMDINNNIIDNNISNNCSDLLKDNFFSVENMNIIQNKIIMSIFYKSNETLRINKIKNETLIQVMNSIWLKYCQFLPYDLKKQIINLNNKVIEFIVPLLLKESKFYFNYLKDSDRTNLPILDRPIKITNDRKQTLPAFYK
jgi:hypothetical protein